MKVKIVTLIFPLISSKMVSSSRELLSDFHCFYQWNSQTLAYFMLLGLRYFLKQDVLSIYSTQIENCFNFNTWLLCLVGGSSKCRIDLHELFQKIGKMNVMEFYINLYSRNMNLLLITTITKAF